jgi:hypothetical protein
MSVPHALLIVLSVPAAFLASFAFSGLATSMVRIDLEDSLDQVGLTPETLRVELMAVLCTATAVGVAVLPSQLPPPWLVAPALLVGGILAFRARQGGLKAIRGGLLRIDPADVDRAQLSRAGLGAFLYRQWIFSANLAFAVAGLYCVTQLLTTVVRATNLAEDQLLIALELAALFAGLLLTTPVMSLAVRSVERFWIGAATQCAIEGHLRAADGPVGGIRPHEPTDPYGRRRQELARVGELLEQLANRYDRMVPAGARPQPTATLLRACAGALQRHLTNLQSLVAATPAELKDVLRRASVVLAGPKHAASYDELSELVHAFSPDGSPITTTSTAKPDSSRLARRLAEAVDVTHKTALALVGIVVVGASLYLLVTRRISLCDFADQTC